MSLLTNSVTLEEVEDIVGSPAASWENRCHEISLKIVKSDLFPYARVARGTAVGIGSQHSWVVLNKNVYNRYALILDPTYYVNIGHDPLLWWGTTDDGIHYPKGHESIWDVGLPLSPVFENTSYRFSRDGLSAAAISFLHMIEPLDIQGWAKLANGPMVGWPSEEIIARMYEDDLLRPLIPIDIVGMVTDINPKGLYLK